jgi:hypothetical protein
MESDQAMDVATAYNELESWTDEEESCDLRKQVHSYDPNRRKRQKAPIGTVVLKPHSSSQSSSANRPKSPPKQGPPKKTGTLPATSSDSTEAIAAAVATAVAAHLAAQAKAAPAMDGMMAASSQASTSQAAASDEYAVAALTISNDQSLLMGCSWTKAVNTIVRAEAAARKASAYATTCAEAFSEVAYTLKKQIDILENLGVYQPGAADS